MSRVTFAGWEAVFGFWVVAFFWAVLALVVVLLGLAGATMSFSFPIGAAEVLTYVGCVAGVTCFGVAVARQLGRCRAVDVAADGTWILRNCIGHELGRIAPDTPRAVVSWSQQVMSGGTSVRFWRRSHVRITAGGHTWLSCYSIPAVTAKAVARLHEPPFA